jgi:2-polyprenyl-3-methyl-5-hydroxy-6-metoxy-1,4-benzoquinol methylase
MNVDSHSYKFLFSSTCNMCGSNASTHKILGKRLNQSQGKHPKNKVGITTTVLKCNQCNLIYANPMPVPLDIQDHYGVPPEEYWSSEYQLEENPHFEVEIKQLKQLFEIKAGMKALDIGAGLGKAMVTISEAGFDTYGLEPSKQFYVRAIEKTGIHPDKLKMELIENASYPEKNFDFITFGAVLEHLYDPSESILKALKWIKPEGIIHIEVPSSNWLTNKLVNLFYRLSGSDYVSNISPMHKPYHLYEFGLKSFEEHAKRNKYDLVYHEFNVCQTYLPKFANFLLKPYMRWTDQGMQLQVWLRKK